MKKINLFMVLCVLQICTLPYVSAVDTDQDGIEDNVDLYPNDFDNDGMPDSWEMQYGLRFDYSGDASEDLDADGVVNLQEFRTNTDPTILNSQKQTTVPEQFSPISIIKYMLIGIVVALVVLIALLIYMKLKKKPEQVMAETKVLPKKEILPLPPLPKKVIPPLAPKLPPLAPKELPSLKPIQKPSIPPIEPKPEVTPEKDEFDATMEKLRKKYAT